MAVIDVVGSALGVKWGLRFLTSYCSNTNAERLTARKKTPGMNMWKVQRQLKS